MSTSAKSSIPVLYVLLLLLCINTYKITASTCYVGDSLRTKNKQYEYLFPYIAPTLLVAYGTSSIANNGWPSSIAVREARIRHFPNFHSKVDDFLWVTPIAAAYSLNALGIKGAHDYRDLTALYLLSTVATNAITQPMKYTIRTLRPDGSTYNSFPSNHTAMAFVAAEVFYQEYKHKSIWYGIMGYTVASSVGVMRILNDRHWYADVLVGAGIAMISTKLIYWVYPRLKKRLGFF